MAKDDDKPSASRKRVTQAIEAARRDAASREAKKPGKARDDDEPEADEDDERDDDEREADEGDEREADEGEGSAPGTKAARSGNAAGAEGSEGGDDDEEEHDGQVAASLGIQRYVLSGFFLAGMIVTYVLGRSLEGIWGSLSNKSWFAKSVPQLAAVQDETKGTLAMVIAGVISFGFVIRTYRKPDVRTWSQEVASELQEVKWPTKKEVQSSTIVVIAASAVATLYLLVLDRLWSFVTDIVYGGGS